MLKKCRIPYFAKTYKQLERWRNTLRKTTLSKVLWVVQSYDKNGILIAWILGFLWISWVCPLPDVIFVTPVPADGSVKFLPELCKFLQKQPIKHNQHKKLSLLIYLCFFSQNCWTSLCLTKKCPNYWYSLIFAHKSSLKRSQITNFTGVIKFLAWKSSCVDFLTNIMSFFALHELKIFYWICWVV